MRWIFPSPWSVCGIAPTMRRCARRPSGAAELEAFGLIGALDDLNRPIPEMLEGIAQLRPTIGTVGEDVTQPGAGLADGLEHRRRPVSILNIGAVDDETKHQADGIDKDVTLAALNPLARVEARYSATFRGLHALAVDPAPQA